MWLIERQCSLPSVFIWNVLYKKLHLGHANPAMHHACTYWEMDEGAPICTFWIVFVQPATRYARNTQPMYILSVVNRCSSLSQLLLNSNLPHHYSLSPPTHWHVMFGYQGWATPCWPSSSQAIMRGSEYTIGWSGGWSCKYNTVLHLMCSCVIGTCCG